MAILWKHLSENSWKPFHRRAALWGGKTQEHRILVEILAEATVFGPLLAR